MFFTTKKFWTDAAERAVKSFGQAVAVALTGNVIDAWSLDYLALGGVGLGGALASVVTSLASGGVGEKGTASLFPVTRHDVARH